MWLLIQVPVLEFLMDTGPYSTERSGIMKILFLWLCIRYRAINDQAKEIKNVTKGKEDDKVYRGLNYYNQYIDKKESLIGTYR